MGALTLLIAGDPLPATAARCGGFDRLITEVVAPFWRGAITAIDVRAAPDLPLFEDSVGLIVSGSASSVTERLPWMLATEAYLAEAVRRELPVLGICFGHQLLGSALGGAVERNPSGREMGSVLTTLHSADELIDADCDPFIVNMTHVDSVTRLPPGARVLARTALDPHAAVRFGPSAWGVQFHPEVDGNVMREYIEGRRALLDEEGIDAEALLARVGDGDGGRRVLERFVRLCARSL